MPVGFLGPFLQQLALPLREGCPPAAVGWAVFSQLVGGLLLSALA